MGRVRFSELALADLQDIASYIGRDSDAAARRVINRIEDVCRILADVPGMGHLSAAPPARTLTVAPWRYKIVYQVDAATRDVVILRVYHGARDLPY